MAPVVARGQQPRHIMERLLSRVDVTAEGCWLWLGSTCNEGYGQIRECGSNGVKGRLRLVHIVAYEHCVGPVPEGFQLDHFACEIRSCCNPDHVRPVTPRENTLRSRGVAAFHAAKTHCINGHVFDEANTHLNARGDRQCRRCWIDATRRYQLRKRLP